MTTRAKRKGLVAVSEEAAETETLEATLEGNLDAVAPDGLVYGWCFVPAEPDRRCELAILIDGTEVIRTHADQYREDLEKAGKGDGHHAFSIQLPGDSIEPGATVSVVVWDVATGRQIGIDTIVTWAVSATPAATAEPETPHSASLADEPIPALRGNIDRITRDGWVSGWCADPLRPGAAVALSILVDGKPVGTTVANGFRPDLKQAGIGQGNHGFSYALPWSALAQRGTLHVSVRDIATDRPLGEPVMLRLGRAAAAEERIEELERQVRQLRWHLAEMTRTMQANSDERAARELFGTVAAFFQQLPEGDSARASGGLGLRAAVEAVTSRHPPLTLTAPDAPAATVCIAATASFGMLYECLAACHAARVDELADIVVLNDGRTTAEATLLPGIVRNLRYVRLPPGTTLDAGRDELARTARGEVVVFLAPTLRPAAHFLDELLATFACHEGAAAISGCVVAKDGAPSSLGLIADEEGMPRDLCDGGDITPGCVREVEAASGLALAVRPKALLAVGGIARGYDDFGSTALDLCMRLRGAGHRVLCQPRAVATWADEDATELPDTAPDLSRTGALQLREMWRDRVPCPSPVGHALVIDTYLPDPDRDAGSIATLEQMELLQRLGWRVTFAPADDTIPKPADIARLERLGIEVTAISGQASVTQHLQDCGASLGIVQIYRHPNSALFRQRVRRFAPAAKLIFSPADLHFLRERRRAEQEGGQAAAAHAEATRAQELTSIRASDMTVVVSDHERDVLMSEGIDPGRLVLLRWIERPRPAHTPFSQRSGLIFVGNFNHSPNADGITWFVQEVLPLVHARLPELRLHVVGSNVTEDVRALIGPRVEVHGWVQDLAPLFAGVRLSIAPLRWRGLQRQGRDEPRLRRSSCWHRHGVRRHRPQRRGWCDAGGGCAGLRKCHSAPA
jgi:hypothetical protein